MRELVGVVVGLLVLWLLLVAALYVGARRTGRRMSLREVVRLVPDVVRLLRRVAVDPTVPRRIRVGLWLLLADVVRENARTWQAVLRLDDAAVRPDPATWSTLEYACHVRDVNRIFDLRVGLMLDEDDPTFANWDQDETAIAERYGEQDPATVSAELLEAAESVAARYAAVPDDAWERRGYRSNGSEFTIDSIGRYHLHDLVHHAWDVRSAVARATVAAYDANAADYAARQLAAEDLVIRRAVDFAAAVGQGARILEIGSAGGRDAAALEAAGVDVRCTDVSPAFVDL